MRDNTLFNKVEGSKLFATLAVNNLIQAIHAKSHQQAMLRLDWAKRDFKLCIREARKEGRLDGDNR